MRIYVIKIALFIFSVFTAQNTFSQETGSLKDTSLAPILTNSQDSIINTQGNTSLESDTAFGMEIQKEHSPAKASIMSAIFPGLGQLYNKKYWKLPIIYGGIGYTIFIAQQRRAEFRVIKEAYLTHFNDDPSDDSYTQELLTVQGLATGLEEKRKASEQFYIIAGLLYVLNIVDASVDAHLYSFDVSNDLSFQAIPLEEDFHLAQSFNSPIQYSLFSFKLSF